MGGLAHNLHEIISTTKQLHSGSSDPVADAATAVGDVQSNLTGESFTLWLDYTKGTEDGVDIWVTFYRTKTGTAGREQSWESIGGGVLIPHNRVYRFTASQSNIPIPIDTETTYKYFRVWNVKVGAGAASGTFTINAEVHDIAR
jgi:hypothetical protein